MGLPTLATHTFFTFRWLLTRSCSASSLACLSWQSVRWTGPNWTHWPSAWRTVKPSTIKQRTALTVLVEIENPVKPVGTVWAMGSSLWPIWSIAERLVRTEQQEEQQQQEQEALLSLASLSFSPLPSVFLPCDFSCHVISLVMGFLLSCDFSCHVISLAMGFLLSCDFSCHGISLVM